MSKLGKMLATGEPELIDISIYYTFQKNKKGAETLNILEEEEAKKKIEAEAKEDKKSVEVLNTKWKQVSWREQNQIIQECQIQNPMTGQNEVEWTVYRDKRIKTLLVDWDMDHEGRKIPVSPDLIDQLPAEVILKLYDNFEKATSLDDETEGK